MTTDTAIGLDDPSDDKQSGIDDEVRERRERHDGDSAMDGDAAPDLTSEDIEAGNDHNTSADQGNRSPKTDKIIDDAVQLGN